jgi:hypothetical protein
LICLRLAATWTWAYLQPLNALKYGLRAIGTAPLRFGPVVIRKGCLCSLRRS